MSEYPSTVIDEAGNVHRLKPEPIGRGGQGIVFRTYSPHIAVKLLGTPIAEAPPKSASKAPDKLWSRLTRAADLGLSPPDSQRQAFLRHRLETVRTLPLEHLHIAQPLSILRDQTGYSMRLLTDMVPIRSLIAEPGTPSLAEFFLSTGGVRRRLKLLTKVASLLSRLHAIPLVYADISPNNVFISSSPEATEVWLIDADNLDYLSSNAPGIYTPGFGAPELVSNRAGMTTLSDSFSFALLAFYVLAQTHPFLGDYVEDLGWDQAEDREALAYQGQVPWIDDPKDPCNRTAHGISRDLVLSKPLRDLFQQAFGPGRIQREARPSMAQWAEELMRAADRVVSCKACGSTYDVTAGSCRFCSAGLRPSFIHLQVNRWDPGLNDEDEASVVSSEPVWHMMLDPTHETLILRHVLEPVLADSDDPAVLRVRPVPRGLYLEPLGDYPVYVVTGNQLHAVVGETCLPFPKRGSEIYLHFGAKDRPHRMAALRYFEEGV